MMAGDPAGRPSKGEGIIGQYHQAFAYKPDGQIETIEHYRFGCGAKLLEQVWAGSPYMTAVGLMATVGPWKGSKLIVIGDYAEPGDPIGDLPGHPDTWWSSANGEGEDVIQDVTDDTVMMVSEATGWSFEGSGWMDAIEPSDLVRRKELAMKAPGSWYLACPALGEYLEPEAFGSPKNYLVMPLFGGVWGAAYCMLACSDGRGGGDSRLEPAGRWAGHEIVPILVDELGGFTDVTKWFQDQMQREAEYLNFR